MTQDRVFLSPAHAGSFRFNEEVVQVFDNMISRSVPLYEEITRLSARFAAEAAQDNTNIYDLGCSTCNTLLATREKMDPSLNVNLIGCDPSEAMLIKAKDKLSEDSGIELRLENAQEADLNNASAIIMNFTLQFVPPAERPSILKKICDSLLPGGIFVFSEKIQTALPPKFDALALQLYDEFKILNGYADSEIANKRKALENVLIPLSHEDHKKALAKAGFAGSAIISNWLNFSCLIAWK
jgi:tRNA (cmo5U34)-methyltransferase